MIPHHTDATDARPPTRTERTDRVPVCWTVLSYDPTDIDPMPSGPATEASIRIRRLGHSLHSIAGALRRRGLWLVFGALGGLIGGLLVATSATAPITYKRYYKATSVLRVETPAVTIRQVDPIPWSLQLAQMTVAGDAYRLAVATESGLSTKAIKNHLISIANDDTATLELTAVTTQADTAEQIAYHAAMQLNRSMVDDVESRRSSYASGVNESLASVNRLIDALRDQLDVATGRKRVEVQKNLEAAQNQARLLREERQGLTTTAPTFVVTSLPTAIRINAHAYFTRWSLANNDLGIPRIKAKASLANVATDDVLGQQAVRASLIGDTEFPEPHVPPKIQPISLGLLAGLLMGLSGVVLGEAWDERIHDSVHARRTTGLDVIVEIPRLSPRRLRALVEDPASVDPKVADAQIRYQEAAWVIASSLRIDPRQKLAETARRDGSPRPPEDHRAPIVLVTSTTPSEGKTTSTAALASALGSLGFSVLAVDGDYHHRSLRKLLRPIPSFVDPDAPATTKVEGVWHLDDPASADRKITSSTIVARLIRRADAQRGNFDIILLDTPPVLATTDAIEYLQYADAAVLIVRLEQTLADACEQTVNTILRRDMVIPGMIVTDVPRAAIDQHLDSGG